METPEIPGYKIRRVIGSGGMATVYLALQENLHREVALKVMTPGLSVDEIYCHRFLKEGRIAAQLAHQNLLTVYDIGVHNDEHYYMASEYLPGGTVRDRMNQGITVDEIVQVMFEMAQGLDYAHAKGFVHRDLKPGNMFYRASGESVLGDFGIAKSVDSTTNATRLGTSIGTPHYMSPEQAKGEKVDHRTDLYSLGICFYELLTGHPPFDGSDPFTVALMQINEAPEPLPDKYSNLAPVVDKLLAKDREERYANAGEFIAALEAVTGEVAPANRGTRRRISDAERQPSDPPDSTADNQSTPEKRASQKPAPRARKPRSTPRKMSQQVRDRSASSPLRVAKILAIVMALIAAGGTIYLGFQKNWFGSEVDPPPGGEAQDDLIKRVDAALSGAARHLANGAYFAPRGANAYESYQQVLRLSPDSSDALDGLGALYRAAVTTARERYAEGNEESARALANEVLRRDPGHTQARQLMARIDAAPLEAEDNEPVATDSEATTDDDQQPVTDTQATSPGDIERLILRGNRYLDDNDIINAARDFRAVLALDPANVEAQSRISRIAEYWATAAERQLALGNVDRARTMIERGLEAQPDDPTLLNLREQL